MWCKKSNFNFLSCIWVQILIAITRAQKKAANFYLSWNVGTNFLKLSLKFSDINKNLSGCVVFLETSQYQNPSSGSAFETCRQTDKTNPCVSVLCALCGGDALREIKQGFGISVAKYANVTFTFAIYYQRLERWEFSLPISPYWRWKQHIFWVWSRVGLSLLSTSANVNLLHIIGEPFWSRTCLVQAKPRCIFEGSVFLSGSDDGAVNIYICTQLWHELRILPVGDLVPGVSVC